MGCCRTLLYFEEITMKLSQKYLNTAFVLVIVGFLIGIVTKLFNLDPVSFFGNLLIYILLFVGVGLAIPAVLGFGWSLLIQMLDDKFGKRGENLSDGIHFWTALLSSAGIGWMWAKSVIPFISVAHSLSVWPIEMFRLRTLYEGYTAGGWVLFAGIFFAIGYAVYFFNKKSPSDE